MHYDLSADAPLAFPEQALAELRSRLGDYVVVSSWARDACLHLGAGLPLGRATDDLDIAVATPTLDDLDTRLGDLGPRRGHGVRISCEGVPIDVLPYGRVATPDQIVEPALDSTLEVTGLTETFHNSDTVRLPGGLIIRTASLPCMVAEELIAWDVRTPGTDKDAEDLADLLEATYSGRNRDQCYDHESADRFDYQPDRIGPYSVGYELAKTLEPSTISRIAGILNSPRVERLIALMSTPTASYAAPWDALVLGLTDGVAAG